MADYTDWDVNDYLPGKPLTSNKAISYHENLDAVAEGAPNAPRIQAEAMQGSVAGDTVLFAGSTPGKTYSAASGPLQSSMFRATTNCEVRIKAEARSTDDAIDVTYNVFKNNTAVFSETISGTSFVATTPFDVTLAAGDVLEVGGQGATVGSESANPIVRNITYNTGTQRSVGGI